MDERVFDFMLPFFSEEYANPGSPHLFGHSIGEAIEEAQLNVARLIGAGKHDFVFTSGATESINLAIKGLRHHSRKHIVTVATEHKAVLEPCRYMEREGFTVNYLKVNRDGTVDRELLKEAITDETCLVSAMLVNNETGVILPIKEMAAMAHARGALFMTDATQAVGKIAVDVRDLNVDLLAFSAHKFYGPKGIGALYISPKIKNQLGIQVHGGGQQRNRRSGTLNMPGIVGLGKACDLAQTEMAGNEKRIRALRDRLEQALLQTDKCFLNGHQQNRIHTTSNICFRGIESERLIPALQNIAVSNGAACSAISFQPSHVLKAMGLSDEEALASIRFSLGNFNTAEEIETTIEKVSGLIKQFRN